jgi:fructose/tagatose bisphosphate aldolase
MVDQFALVMFDGSGLPFSENMRRTAEYVKRFGEQVMVEGAVDELKESSEKTPEIALTEVQEAEWFARETRCDLLVPNVGTEHRASEAGVARYHAARAREIAAAVGRRMVLHGTSCLEAEDLRGVPGDGFVKVNIWTDIERTGARATVGHVLGELGRMVRPEEAAELARGGCLEGVLSGKGARDLLGGEAGPDLRAFPLVELRRRWVDAVSRRLQELLELLGYARLAD